ncbi:MAG TPA: MFS transporter [Dehalococcoidia bacterium]|nr:MFS transporter [Dehalococcoidia bacterium]
MNWASAGPLIPLLIETFGMSRSAAGWYASIAPLSLAVVSLPINMVVARFGLNKTFAVGAFLMSAGALAIFTDEYLLLLILRAIFAIGTALIVPIGTAITAEWFGNNRLPIINGISMSFANLGHSLAFATAIPIAAAISWKAPIFVYGGFTLACAIAWAFFGKEYKTEQLETETVTPEPAQLKSKLSLRQILTNRYAILLTLSVTVSWGCQNAFNSWLPDYYYNVFNIPLADASSIIAISKIGGIAASILGGILSTRLGRRKPFLIISGIFTGLSGLIAILFNNPTAIYTGVLLLAIFGPLFMSSIMTIPMEIPQISLRSGVIVVAMMLVGGNLGNFASPLIVGYLVDVTGSYLPGFITFIVLSYILLLAGILLPETGPAGRTSNSNR